MYSMSKTVVLLVFSRLCRCASFYHLSDFLRGPLSPAGLDDLPIERATSMFSELFVTDLRFHCCHINARQPYHYLSPSPGMIFPLYVLPSLSVQGGLQRSARPCPRAVQVVDVLVLLHLKAVRTPHLEEEALRSAWRSVCTAAL